MKSGTEHHARNTMNCFSRSFTILLTIGLLCNQAAIGHTAPRKAPDSSKTAFLSTQVEQLQSRLTKALAQKDAAFREMQKYPVFYVRGKIQSGDARSIQVYGKAIGAEGTTGQEFGWLTDETFFEVWRPDPSYLSAGSYNGYGTFFYTRRGTNTYGPVPAAYQQALAKRNQYDNLADTIRTELTAKTKQLEAQQERQIALDRKRQQQAQYAKNLPLFKAKTGAFLTSFQQAQKQQGSSATFYYTSAQQTIELYNQLGKGRYDATALSNHAVVSLVRSAVYDAEAGRLSKSAQTLREAARLKSSKTGGLFSLKLQAKEQSELLRATLDKNRVLSQRLTGVWLSQLPRYVEQPIPATQKAEVVQTASWLSTLLSPLEAPRYSQSLTRLVERTQTLEMASTDGTVDRSRITRRPLDSDAPVFGSGRPLTDSNALSLPTQSTTSPATTAPEIRVTPERLTALDFQFKALDGTVEKLSDFKGQVVVLYFWPPSEEYAESPTPLEQINRFVREYNGPQQTSSQVALITPGTQQNYDEALTFFLDRVRTQQEKKGQGMRDYPEPLTRFYAAKEGQASNDVAQSSRIGLFYRFDGFNTLNVAIVIDGEGKVVGAVPFVSSQAERLTGGSADRYNLNTKKLEGLIQSALTKKAPTP